MKRFETFGELVDAIEQQSIEGMEAVGYWFLETFLDQFIENDSSTEPLFLCQRRPSSSKEEYSRLLHATPVPDYFWEHLKVRADSLIDYYVDTAEENPYHEHNFEGGTALLNFLVRYLHESK